MDHESLSFKLMALEVEMGEIFTSIEELKWLAVAFAFDGVDGEGLAPTLEHLNDSLQKVSKQVKNLRWYLYGEE